MVTIDEELAEAVNYHRRGQLAAAEQVYRRILAVNPENGTALHLLGQLRLQLGHVSSAIEFLERAVQSDRRKGVFHASLGDAYRRSGQLAAAASSLRYALEIQPTLALGHLNLGHLLSQQGILSEAETAFREAVRLAPEDAQAHATLGRFLYGQGRLADSEACFRRAMHITPASAVAHGDLATVLQSQAKLEEAQACYQVALKLSPQDAETHSNLGVVLAKLKRRDEAEAHFREALRISPRSAAAYSNLSVLMAEQGRFTEAADYCRQVIALDPSATNAFTNLAGALQNLGELDEAIAAAQRAIQLDPNTAAAFSTLGLSLQARGELDEAVDAFRAGLRIDASDASLASNLLYALNFHPCSKPAEDMREHLDWADRYAEPLTAASVPHANQPDPRRRLRVGYVSGHFHSHAVSAFSEPLLAAHDHERFEIVCYSSSVKTDATTKRFKSYADEWRDIEALRDDEAAAMVRRDRIDVLVDLAGHIGGNRLLVFARRPAPIQVTYLGYQNTTGMSAMDYRLTDAYADPPGMTEMYYTEELVRLPRTFFCYQPRNAPPVGPSPADANGFVTFGSFNNFAKVTPAVLDTWARILMAVPRSRLILLAHVTPVLKARVVTIFERHGVGADRLELAQHRPHREYLELMSRVDIALDPFPFNGHTTTCDCLWQGLGVVNLAGANYASRFGGSALVNLDLSDWIADTSEDYVERARGLSGKSELLRQLRANLRERMRASPLMDAGAFARHLESAYRSLWERWCAKSSGAEQVPRMS